MPKMFARKAMLTAVLATLALPATAQAGDRDCLDKAFRDVDRVMTRVVHHTDRALTGMFRWCDRHRR
jgi:hypothetical protein